MKSGSLRVEFVVSGTAFLLAAYAAWLAARRLIEYDPISINDWLGLDPRRSTAEVILFTALFFGAAFAVGALLVQLTFEKPGRAMIFRARKRTLQRLIRRSSDCRADEDCGQIARFAVMAVEVTPPTQSPISALLSNLLMPWGWGREPDQQPHSPSEKRDAMDLLVVAGWLRIGAEAAREVEYRRSNRQIFLGLLPGVIVGVVAAWMALLRGFPCLFTIVLLSIVALIAVIGAKLAYAAAEYQEERVADLLLCAALLQEDDKGRVRMLPTRSIEDPRA
jgi:uncharacterized membrane protein